MTGSAIVDTFASSYTVTVKGIRYLVYRDGRYTHAVLAADAERVAEAEVGDYTGWCDHVRAVDSVRTARAIMAEAGIDILHLGDGCGTVVQAT